MYERKRIENLEMEIPKITKFIKDGDIEKFVRINWQKYPVLDKFRVF